MSEQSEEVRPPERKEVTFNIAGACVGFVLFGCLVWSLFAGEMQFAYFLSALLFALAVSTHALNMLYK